MEKKHFEDNKTSRIAVVITAYNVENYIERCIKSVQNQTYGNWKIYAINDGSVDRTGDILEKMSKEDKRIIFYSCKNKGTIAARKFVIDKIKDCEYITFLDSDDFFCDSNLFYKCIGRLAEETGNIILTFNYLREGKRGFSVNREVELYSQKEMLRHMLIKDIVDGNMCYTVYSENIVKKNFKVRDYNNDEILNKYEILLDSDKLIYVPWNAYFYYKNPSSQTQQDIREMDFIFYEHVCMLCDNIVSRYSELSREADYFRCYILLWIAEKLNKKKKFRNYQIYKRTMKLLDANTRIFLFNRYFNITNFVSWLLLRVRVYYYVYTIYHFLKGDMNGNEKE